MNTNTTHMQLNGNNQLQITPTTIIVNPIKLQTRAKSLNPNLHLSERQKQIQANNNNLAKQQDTTTTATTKSPLNLQIKKIGIPLNQQQSSQTKIQKSNNQSSSAPKKISGSFSSRVIFRAKTKSEDEIQKKDSVKTISSIKINDNINNENQTPNNKVSLPPIQQQQSYNQQNIKFYISANNNNNNLMSQNNNNNQVEQNHTSPTQMLKQGKMKENSFVKRKQFDFLERTKVKNQSEESDLIKLSRYFRCKISSMITGSGKKQYYLSFLKEMKDLTTKIKQYERAQKQIQSTQDTMNKLKKIVATRAKYRYKEKIDFTRSIMMRTLGFESRAIIQQIKENMALEDEEYEDLEDDADREQDEINKKKQEQLEKNQKRELISPEIVANWKKMRGYQPNQKIFICIGQYTELKNYLKEQGWIENANQDSLIFDLKWVTKKKDVDKEMLLDQQMTNHFQKNHNLTSKNGIALNLRNLIWYDNVDIDIFYPRCYDLSDVQEFEDFVEEFKITKAESILKLYLAQFNYNNNKAQQQNQINNNSSINKNNDGDNNESNDKKEEIDGDENEDIKDKNNNQVEDNNKKNNNNNNSKVEEKKKNDDQKNEKYIRLKILLACSVMKRRTYSFEKKLALIGTNNLPIVTPEEWNILNRDDNYIEYLEQNNDVFNRISQQLSRDMDSEEINSTNLIQVVNKYIKLSADYDPQSALNQNNLWIVKPAGLSRGRGIRSFDQIEPLLNYIIGKDVMWVAQKYMENPLTIHKKKFDIRQWVLVTEWNPLTIYFYDECYIRVCFDEYNPSDLQNKFAHLANNCISKHAENFEEKINDTMMYLADFVDYIKSIEGGKDMYYNKIQKQMIDIIINSIKSCKDSVEHRKNSLELYGYDFMVDSDYNTWLIEINSSPSMEYSTNVTTRLVKMGLQDIGKVIHQHFVEGEKKFNKNTEYGLWKNIYRESK